MSAESGWCDGCGFRTSVDERGQWLPGDYDHRAAVVADAMVITGELSAAARLAFIRFAPAFAATLAELVSTSEAVSAS